MKGLVYVICIFPALVFAQQGKLIHHQISPDSMTVDSVLSILHATNSIQLSYDPAIVPDVEIPITKGKWTALNFLKAIKENTHVDYKKVGKNFILILREKSVRTISGHVLAENSGEHLIGALVRIKSTNQGVITNQYGFFSLEVPKAYDSIEISYLGFESKFYEVPASDHRRDIKLKESISLLKEVIVQSAEEESLASPDFGLQTMKSSQFKSIGGALGERDVLRQLQQSAGVAMASESNAGFSVRGGRPNQNLVLLDEAVVYNPTHFIGFFSIFNVDALNKVDFYREGIPSRYGGRLASVTNVMMKEGNNQKFAGSGNINLIAGSLSLEGPIKKDKGSFILSGRRTYPDLYLEQVQDVGFFFYDVNLKTNYRLGKRDRIYWSAYFGMDVFKIPSDEFRFRWGNYTSTLRWNHEFNAKLFLNTSFILSSYEYNLETGTLDQNLDWLTELEDLTLKGDLDYFFDNNTRFNFGGSLSFHQVRPAELTFEDSTDPSLNDSGKLSPTQGLENALYGEVERKVTDRVNVLAGLRFSSFHNVGSAKQFVFDDQFEPIDTIQRKSREFYHTYFNVEPRVSMSYLLNDVSSVKASYNRMVQYVSQASNSLSGTPLDVWFLSSPNVKPQVSDQWSIGYFRKFEKANLNLSVETFYRSISNEIDFKDNAQLLLNEQLEGELRVGSAKAYGVEVSLSKNEGKLTGSANLTWSRSLLEIPLANKGLTYPSSYDRPINIAISPSIAFNDRKRLNINWVFLSGLPFTSPTGRFTFGNLIVPSFSNRNGDRLPNYHRLDIGYEIDGKNKKNRRISGSWSFVIYNVYNRLNANFISFQTVEGTNRSEAVKFTVFGFLPSVSYRFKF